MSMETNQTFDDLAQVVEHELFPDVDLALRRGRHIDREDAAWYGFLSDAQAKLEGFYRRFGAELVQRTDGFFFLLPSGDKLGRRHLSPSEMLVGQGLTLLYLEPATVEQGGITSRDALLSQLSASMGTEQLMFAFNAKKKRLDERVAQEMVRTGVSQAIRRLASLGFVELLTEERIRLRSSLMRFAEPVRGSGADLEALTRLVASGEVALSESDDDDDDDDEATDGDDTSSLEADSSPAAHSAPLPAWNEGSEWGASFDSPATEHELDPALRTLPKANAQPEPEAEPESEAKSEPESEPQPELEPESGDEEPSS
jgi:chromosome partition protein MukE